MALFDEIIGAGKQLVVAGEAALIGSGEYLASKLTEVLGAAALGVGVADMIVKDSGQGTTRVITKATADARARRQTTYSKIGGGVLPSSVPIVTTGDPAFDIDAAISGLPGRTSARDDYLLLQPESHPYLDLLASLAPLAVQYGPAIIDALNRPRAQSPVAPITPESPYIGDAGLISDPLGAASYYPSISDFAMPGTATESAFQSKTQQKNCDCAKKKPKCKPGWHNVKKVTYRSSKAGLVTQKYRMVRKFKDCQGKKSA